MKYYAVTEDPNELLHYGVKGMKWGKHIFGDKPRSPGYHRALGKLRASVSKSNKTPKPKIPRQERKLQRQQEKYNKAIQKAQERLRVTESLRALNQAKDYRKSIDRQFKRDMNAAKIAAKRERRYAKNESKMDKYLKQARQGKLKYGKLSEEQIQRIQNRLNLENRTRDMGNKEVTWRSQKKAALRKGKLSGIEKGTAAVMEEVARAGTIYGIQNFMNRKKMRALAKEEGKEERIKTKEKNKKTRKDIRRDIKREAYEEELRSGLHWGERHGVIPMTAGNAARTLKALNEKKARENAFEKLALDEGKKERALENKARLAYEYGFLNSGEKDKKQLSEYYQQRYIDKETNQQREARAKKEAKSARKEAEKIKASKARAEKEREREQRMAEAYQKRLDEYKALYDYTQQQKAQEKAQKELIAEQARLNNEANRAAIDYKNTSTKKKQRQKNNK